MNLIILAAMAQAASACPMGGMGGPGMGPGSHGGGMVSGVLMGAAAALGWWVLTKAQKESDKVLKWSGRVLAWVLMLGGLSGFLCAGLSHARGAWGRCSTCVMHGGGGSLPPGHPSVGNQAQP